MVIKGELFSQPFIPKLIDGSKVRTSRPVKRKYNDSVFEVYQGTLCEASPEVPPVKQDNGLTRYTVRNYVPCKPKYQPGDVMYCRETWCQLWDLDGNDQIVEGTQHYYYKANGFLPPYTQILKDDGTYTEDWIWRPSIHMPRETARLFFRVTDVKVQNIADITEQDAIEDGFDAFVNEFGEEQDTPLECFQSFWHTQYGTDANWMWVYYFKQITREEALKDESDKA